MYLDVNGRARCGVDVEINLDDLFKERSEEIVNFLFSDDGDEAFDVFLEELNFPEGLNTILKDYREENKR